MKAGASHYPQHPTADLPLFAAPATVVPAPVAPPGTPPAAPLQAVGSMPAEPLPAEVARLVTALEGARGEERAINAQALAAQVFGAVDADHQGGNNSGAVRRVRQLLALYLDRLPWPVAAGDRGYYRPATETEAAHYHASLVSRAAEILARDWTYCQQCRGQGFAVGPSDPVHLGIERHLAALHEVCPQ